MEHLNNFEQFAFVNMTILGSVDARVGNHKIITFLFMYFKLYVSHLTVWIFHESQLITNKYGEERDPIETCDSDAQIRISKKKVIRTLI